MNNAQVSSAISIPSILTANTYFWSPSGSADGRRRSEERKQSDVAAFFAAAGFQVTREGDNVNATGHGLQITFHYSESCKIVYKSLEVYRDNGKKSNITAIRKALGIS